MLRSLDIIEMFSGLADVASTNREYLCRIGLEDGDGDYGLTMSFVFNELEQAFAEPEPAETTPAEFFDMAAECFLQVDSPTAAAYASGFRRAGSALMRKRTLDARDFGKLFDGLAGSFRGKRAPGNDRRNARDVWQDAATGYAGALV